MDGEAFEVWLSAVAVLTDQQRGEVLRALALAEARRNEPVAADAGIVLCEASHSAELAPPRPRNAGSKRRVARIAAVAACNVGDTPTACPAIGAMAAVAASMP